ncbi:hypothetical protein O1L55_42065, partial [Streptomyces albulus]|nr:hypothetical protein [Streptomyces noursei]
STYFIRIRRIWVFNLDSVVSRLCFRIYRETLSRFRAPLHNVTALRTAQKRKRNLMRLMDDHGL